MFDFFSVSNDLIEMTMLTIKIHFIKHSDYIAKRCCIKEIQTIKAFL